MTQYDNYGFPEDEEQPQVAPQGATLNSEGEPNPPFVSPPPGGPEPYQATTDGLAANAWEIPGTTTHINPSAYADGMLNWRGSGRRRPTAPEGYGAEADGGPVPPTVPPSQSPIPGGGGTNVPGAGYVSTSVPQGSPGAGGVDQFARDWMQTPSRYDSDLVQKAMASVEAAMARTRQEQGNSMMGYLANRGILSSTPGAEIWQDQVNRLGEQENREYLDILMDQARTRSQDMGAAGGLGLGVDTLKQRGIEHKDDVALRKRALDLQEGGMSHDQAMDQARFEQADRHFDADAGLRNRALDLQKYGIDADTAMGYARLAQDAQQFGVDVAIRNRALDLTEKGMDQDQANWTAQHEWGKTQDIIRNEQWDKGFQFDQDREQTRSDQWEKGFDWDKESWQKDYDWRDESWNKDFDFKTKAWETDVANWAKEFGWKQDEARRYWEWMYASKGVTGPRDKPPPGHPGGRDYDPDFPRDDDDDGTRRY